MTAIIVFSRLGSARLPRKALADLCGRPMLGRVLDRLRRVQLCRRIVVATTERPQDDEIASFAGSEGVEVFRGHDTDVARRALDCCDGLQVEALMRISGDSPFMPPELIDRALMIAKDNNDADLVTNVFPRSYPAGASVEVVKAAALRRAHADMSGAEREHVTTAFYRKPDAWRIVNFAAESDCTDLRLTVDTAAELEAARALTARLMPQPELASLDEVVALRRALEVAA
jgi:spore coat polysaccharide biosynthesis protein SpsF